MKPQNHILALAGALCLATTALQGAEAYPEPDGGWTYIYTGDQLETAGDAALDGTWTHDNGSDQFDGSEIGGELDFVNNPDNGPGGANLLTEGDTQYVRYQDTGDPTDYDGNTGGWDDASNRKVYFGHQLPQDFDGEDPLTILDDGVTLTFRARIPTVAKAGGPLDPLHRDGQSSGGDYPDNGVLPYPDGGDGYLTSDGAKGNFVIRQVGDGGDHPAGAVALSLTVPTDTPGGNPNSGLANFAGLTMNERSGPVPSGNVDFGEGSGENNFPLDPTEWHEFWICIKSTRDPQQADATHDVLVFKDGDLIGTSHKVTAGTGSDLDGSFIANGGSATPQNWALDVDWYGYKAGFVLPKDGQVPPDVIVNPVQGTLFYTADGGLKIDAEAVMPDSTLADDAFEVILNAENISDQLSLTGSASDAARTATYNGLEANLPYTGTIKVTDSEGLVTLMTVSFDTFVEDDGLLVESEDYNDGGGFWEDNPEPGYFQGFPGVENIDYFDTTPDSVNGYRTDGTDMGDGNDVPRQKFVDAGVPDYQLDTVETDEWLNFTRTFPNQAFLPFLRAGAGAGRMMRLEQVTSDATAENQTTVPLGAFRIAQTRTVNTYGYTPATDAFGVPRVLNLDGETTVRLTAVNVENDVNHNYLFFADTGLDETTDSWVLSVMPLPGAQLDNGDTKVEASIIDGQTAVEKGTVMLVVDTVDVTGDSTITDTDDGVDVSYTPSAPFANALHTVVLTYDDGTGGTKEDQWSFTVGEGGQPPLISISQDPDDTSLIRIEFTGVLERADTVDGEFQPVPGAQSPLRFVPEEPQAYFRAVNPAP